MMNSNSLRMLAVSAVLLLGGGANEAIPREHTEEIASATSKLREIASFTSMAVGALVGLIVILRRGESEHIKLLKADRNALAEAVSEQRTFATQQVAELRAHHREELATQREELEAIIHDTRRELAAVKNAQSRVVQTLREASATCPNRTPLAEPCPMSTLNEIDEA
jgi:hypothetical protein